MNASVSTMTGKIKLKVVLLGNQAVGKSSIIQKYVKDIFDESNNPTVGIDFLVKNVTHNSKTYRLQLWDTAGQERFRSLIPNYLKDAKCALIVIDVTSKASLNSVEEWMALYNDNKTGQGFTFLVGNKIDLNQRQISVQEGQKKAQELGIPYFEVSAKTGENIEEFFNKLIEVTQDQSSVNFEMNPRKHQQDPNAIQEEEEEEKPKQPTGETNNIVLNNNNNNSNKQKTKTKGGCC